MYYEDMSNEVQDFLSSVKGHLLAIQELQEQSAEPIVLTQEHMEEHLDTIYDGIPLKITKTKGRGKLVYSIQVEDKYVQLRLFFKDKVFSQYDVAGIRMPAHFREESWWKQ